MSAAGDSETIIAAISEGVEVERVLRIDTLPLETGGLLVSAKVILTGDRSLREAADDIEEIKLRIRSAVPDARVIYLEPDVYRPALDPQPSTDVFVLKSED